MQPESATSTGVLSRLFQKTHYKGRLNALLALASGGNWQPSIFGFKPIKKPAGYKTNDDAGDEIRKHPRKIHPMEPSKRSHHREVLRHERRYDKQALLKGIPKAGVLANRFSQQQLHHRA